MGRPACRQGRLAEGPRVRIALPPPEPTVAQLAYVPGNCLDMSVVPRQEGASVGNYDLRLTRPSFASCQRTDDVVGTCRWRRLSATISRRRAKDWGNEPFVAVNRTDTQRRRGFQLCLQHTARKPRRRLFLD